MRPDTAERRPGGGGIPDAGNVENIVIASPLDGCPCGCRTRLPWIDDPLCVRHRPLPRPVRWPSYDIGTLGLADHDRRLCDRCQAAAS